MLESDSASLKYKNKLSKAALILSAIIIIFLVLLGLLSNSYVKSSEEQRLLQLKQIVQIAVNSIDPILSDFQKGEINNKTALDRIRNIVRRMTFSDKNGFNYIFMSSYDGTMLVQPFETEKELLNQWDLQDSNGQYIIRNLIKVAKSEPLGGYFTYYYPPPHSDKPEEKISFVMGINGLDCYIGAGRYMGDLRKEQQVFQLKVFILVSILLILIIAYLLLFVKELRTHSKKVLKEIQMRIKSEEELNLERIRLKTVVDTIPDLIWLKDIDEKYLFCNPEFEKLFGISEDKIIGKTDYDLVSKEQADKFVENDQSTISINESCIYEEEVIQPNVNGILVVETIKTPMHDSNGKIIGILGTARNITERKRQESELLSLYSYLTNIIDSIPSIIVGIDKDGCISRWNKKFEDYSGYSVSETDKIFIKDILSDFPFEYEEIVKAIENQNIIRSSRKSRIRDKKLIYETIALYPLAGDEIGAVVTIDDVSEKVHLEEIMIQSEKMLSVSGLASGLAHEINNPLAGIIQTASVMTQRLSDETLTGNIKVAKEFGLEFHNMKNYLEKRKILQMLNSIRESGNNVSTIINKMLSFVNTSNSSFSSILPEELLDNSLKFAVADYVIRDKGSAKIIKVIKDYENKDIKIFCDKVKIQQVILNILKMESNEIFNNNERCAGNKSEIEEPQFLITTRYEKPDEMVRIEISDNGPGVENQNLIHLFEPFYKFKNKRNGSELDFSVSYFIITELHKGTLTVESIKCEGTKFIIRLPIKGPNNP